MQPNISSGFNLPGENRFWNFCAQCALSLIFISNALAQTAPTIFTQPQSQTVLTGTNVNFSVAVDGLAAPSLPSVGSGTLQLWLKADAGVVTTGSGQVSQWQDQSGNANHATQANPDNQPLLVYPAGIGGRAALRFNGIADNVHDSYLTGSGDVGVPNALTTFAVYNSFSNEPNGDVIFAIGQPPLYGTIRCDIIYGGDIYFSTWTYDYPFPFLGPTNTYRIWTTELNTNLSAVEVYDNTATTATNFSAAVANATAPAPGYYVGGFNPAVQYVVNSRCFDGDIAELICYRGSLSEADRLAVLAYLQQKYYSIGETNGVSFQWQFDSANIFGATNASLALTDVQTNDAGSYSVIVSNSVGSTASSNAVLLVGNSPSITLQPQSQEVAQGSNVTFTAGATGTAPLNFQWTLNGAALAQATNSTLGLANVQSANAGTYALAVSSPFGAALSSNAVLTIDLAPVIETQPQSQGVIVGNNVTFSVGNGPSVSSGTLQLWLKADAGVVTNASGQVSLWQDQSGNTNDASQADTNNQPLLVYPAEIGGRAALRFNGIQDNVHGSYLAGTGDVGVPNALTTFAVYNYFSTDPNGNEIFVIGQPPNYGSIRSDVIYQGDLYFSTWTYDYPFPFLGPANTYRIWTTELDTNLSDVEVYDNTATTAANFSAAVANAVTPAPGYYVGGLNPAVQYVVNSRCFDGDIAELICYRGSLSDADRLAVLAYLQQKYYQAGDNNGVTFQWQFDGTNIAGATNAAFTLTNVQSADAGTYSVTLTDPAGSTTSSNAVLTTLSPPTITSSPASQSVVAGTTVMFSAAATGTAPVSYQWQFDDANIPGATNTSLTVANALISNAGSYSMVATNPYGSVTSLVATLSVDESTIQVASTSAGGSGTVVVSINLIALGTESGVGFTLNFDPSVLTYTGVVLGSGASGDALEANSSQAASGRLGLGVALFSGTFSAGTQDVFDVSFQVATVTNAISTSLTFGNLPTGEQVSDPLAQALPAVYLPGAVAISPTALEGDVSPRPNGNEALNITDWIQEGRFVAGLDIVSNGSEFQRADCAPRSTLGDGQINVADWVQVGRYAVGLDPLTAAGGPSGPSSEMRDSGHPGKDDLSPSLTLVPGSQGAAATSVAVQLAAQGNVSALQFSVTFNPAMVQFVNASLGVGAPGAALIQNTNEAPSGNLGFVVGLLPPATFAAGAQQLLNLNFAPISYSNTTSLVFSDAPVLRTIVDSNTTVLSATYQDATLAVGGLVWPTLSINQAGNNIVLSWPSSAAGFELQASSSLDGDWTNVVATPAMNGGGLVLTSPISTNTVYYRLKY